MIDANQNTMGKYQRYKVFLNGVEMPTPPSSIKITIPNRNETVDLVDGREYNLTKNAGLTEVEMSLIIPAYPNATYFLATNKLQQKEYLELFEQLKVQSKVLELAIARPQKQLISSDTLLYCTLEDYSIEENAEWGRDLLLTVKFKKHVNIQTGVVDLTTNKVVSNAMGQASKLPEQTSYTVQYGDTLCGIALRFYGDMDKYKYIAEKNNIEDPNVIKKGQVLIL